MLLGSLEYKYNDKIYKYKLKAVDNSSACSLIISSYNFDALKFEVGNNITDDNQNILEERRFDIQMSTVLIQSVISLVDGKKVKGDVNNDFFCRLGALVRYVKSSCSKDNEVGYTGMQLASGEFETSAVNDYIIKFPNTDDILAKVTLSYGDIRKLSITTDLIKLELAEDSSVETQLFPKIKDGVKVGFKLRSEEYLGFPIFESSLDTVRTLDGMYTCIEDIVAAHPDKEFSWLLKKKYILVTDDTLDEICDYIFNYEGYVYYDTETSGLNITFKSRIGQADQCVGIVLSVKYGESFFFPMQMKRIPNLCGGDHFYFMERYMRRILEGKELVAHNMAFDWKVGYIYDINCNIVHDTMAMIKLTIGAERKNYPMGLKENTKLLLGRDSLELSDLIVDNTWGETDIKFWDLPAELVRLYACADTDNTNGLLQYAIQNDLLGRYNARKVYEIEIAFSYAVAYQEFYGHHIDISNLATLREVIGKEQDNIMKQMEEIIGHEFNPNSPKQLTTILYGELGIPEQISRKTGRPTTDKETLNKLAEVTDAEDNIKYPFCALLQKFREYEGVRKIVDKFPEHVTEDGFIFSHVMQYGTTTGRVSINTPNYQSYNDPIKKNIIARDGYWMFDTDYSSVEYRVLGNMVRNERIKKSFEDPDFDYHAYQAARMYSVPYSAVNKKMRKAAKGINFGLPYGMGDESLGIRIFGEASPENTRKASALRTAYFKGQEDIRDWFEFHRDKGVNLGYTETYFGRRRYYHREDFSVNAIRRQAGNQVIQGCIQGDSIIYDKLVGAVKIKELAGYKAEVWDGDAWTTADILYSGKKQRCIITFKDGSTFECSPIHKFSVLEHDRNIVKVEGNRKFVECKDLEEGVVVELDIKSNFSYFSKAARKIIDDSDLTVGLIVDSVEITDEWIDMYDVCNTERGYYVANGIITHNTAADIYKLAVGRVFKRICKEGWLGKVLLSGFIHDELLGEVSNDINPAQWLKVLREEFEVEITDSDGTQWCPLYMGFGYGTSWYEAKSVELPIKFQWEFVDKYGIEGYPSWDGNGRAFCDKIPFMLRDFDIRDIKAQLLDSEAQGKEIKPTLNNQVLDCVKSDSKAYTPALNDYLQENAQEVSALGVETYLGTYEAQVCEYLSKVAFIQGLMRDSEGNIVTEFKPAKDTQEAIDQYCMLHNVDRSLINILNIQEYESNNNVDDDVEYYLESDEDLDTDKLARIIDTKIQTLGMYPDIDNKRVIALLPHPERGRQQFLTQLSNFVNKEGKGYALVFRDYWECPGDRSTTSYITSENLSAVQNLYLVYLGGRII